MNKVKFASMLESFGNMKILCYLGIDGWILLVAPIDDGVELGAGD